MLTTRALKQSIGTKTLICEKYLRLFLFAHWSHSLLYWWSWLQPYFICVMPHPVYFQWYFKAKKIETFHFLIHKVDLDFDKFSNSESRMKVLYLYITILIKPINFQAIIQWHICAIRQCLSGVVYNGWQFYWAAKLWVLYSVIVQVHLYKIPQK